MPQQPNKPQKKEKMAQALSGPNEVRRWSSAQKYVDFPVPPENQMSSSPSATFNIKPQHVK